MYNLNRDLVNIYLARRQPGSPLKSMSIDGMIDIIECGKAEQTREEYREKKFEEYLRKLSLN